jgi:HAD superfamily hydrolase (TIGR01549 family)
MLGNFLAQEHRKEKALTFQGVFFDIDGTLVGLRPPPEVFYRRVCQDFGLDCSEEQLAQARRVAVNFVCKHGLDYLDDELGMWRAANRQVYLHLGAGKRAGDCAARFQEMFYREMEEYLFPDVLPTLDGLRARGYPLGVLTGRLHSSEALLRRLGVRSYFSFYLYAGELEVLKPDPRMYTSALERAGLDASAVVLVGDNVSDVAGAQSVGITPIVIAREGRRQAEDVLHLPNLRDLLPWLDRA